MCDTINELRHRLEPATFDHVSSLNKLIAVERMLKNSIQWIERVYSAQLKFRHPSRLAQFELELKPEVG